MSRTTLPETSLPETVLPAARPAAAAGLSDAASDVAVSVRGLSKSYTIAKNAEQHSTMGEALMHKLKNPLARIEKDTFWALTDLDFDIKKGDVVGVVGRNGAGKSTLLKILSRITEPTRGKIDLYGRVGSLLEVGTGFHPELTGRENIFLNGAILGMKKSEISRQFDEIVEFSGVAKFLDTPVKRYSSGMYVRLAFAVAAHLNPEILIIDEVLAVGDAEFQKKCLGKMQDVASSGRTVLFVSHNMQSVSLLCTQGIFLKNGKLLYQGDIKKVIDLYLGEFSGPGAAANSDPDRRPGTGEYRFDRIAAEKDLFTGAEEKKFRFSLSRRRETLGQMYLGAHIMNSKGEMVAQCDSRLMEHRVVDGQTIRGEFSFRTPWLKPGSYWLDLSLCTPGIVIDFYESACHFDVSPVMPYPGTITEDGTAHGAVFADFSWNTEAF